MPRLTTGTTDRPVGDPQAEPAIRLRGITKRFGPVCANDAVDLDVAPGTIHGIIGENGAGKSTLASIIYGLHVPDQGTIAIHGSAVSIGRPADAIALGIGMVHQHFMLVANFSVLENVMLGAESGFFLDRSVASARERLVELSRNHGLDIDPDARVDSLALGLRQRVEILKILYRGARILLLDEPTAVLTPDEATRLFAILRRICNDGGSVVLISHRLQEIMEACDRITIMRHGRRVGERNAADTTPEELATLMVGRKVRLQTGPRHADRGSVALRVSGLGCAGPDDEPRLHGIDLELRAGEVVGVAGVSGNGQSELLDVLSGMRPVDDGTIELSGHRIDAQHPASPATMRALGLAHVPEDRQSRGLVLPFEMRENAVLGRLSRAGPAPWLRPDCMQSTAGRLIEDMAIRPSDPFMSAAGFSGGNQQKIVLGREFTVVPRVLLLGQPTRGVDVGTIELIHARILALRQQACAILLVSVELDEILALSDRIVVMYEGRIVGQVKADAVTREQLGLMMAGFSAGSTC